MRKSMLVTAFFCLLGVGSLSVWAENADIPAASHTEIQPDINRLLNIEQLLGVMSQEAVAALRLTLGAGLDPADSAVLQINLQRIYAPERLSRLMSEALALELVDQDVNIIGTALRFYDSPAGRRLVGLELSARRALLDPDQMQIADESLIQAQERGDRRLEQIERLVATTDVVDIGVVSGLNSSMQTSLGFYAAIGQTADPQDVAAGAAAIEDQLRADISQWVLRLLLLAYQPLDASEIEALIAFVNTPESRILSDCLNRAFDAVFMRLSFEVGIISGAALGGEEI